MGEGKRVLQVGGIAGLLAGVLMVLAMVTGLILSPVEPPTGIPGVFERFSRSVLDSVTTNAVSTNLFLAAIILAVPLYLALLTFREARLAFALGSISGGLGLVLLALLAFDGGWWPLYGLLFLALSFLAVGAGMLNSSDFHGAFGSVGVVLGLVGFGATAWGVDYSAGWFVGILALVIFLLLLGWKVFSLSRAA